MANTKRKTEDGVLEKTRQKLTKPPLYKVFMLNDDYTTMEFVVEILEVIFRHSKINASTIMLDIHKSGRGLAGVYTKEIAETKIAQVHSAALRSEFPLKCHMEQE